MTTTEREERIAELAAMMQEWGMTRRETLLEILYMVYEVEFPIECLATKISCSVNLDKAFFNAS